MRGLAWWIDGWRLFMRKPLTWIVYTVITWGLVFAGNAHVLLVAVMAVALPILIAGWAGACEAAAAGRSTPISMLFDGFRKRVADLAVIGAVYLFGNVLVLMIFLGVGGEPMRLRLTDPGAMSAADAQALASRLLLALVMVLAVAIPLTAATWFAPLGVHLNALRPGPALLASLRAVLRNKLAFTVYSIVALPLVSTLFIVATSLGLPLQMAVQVTFWVLLPWLVTSVWCSWRDVMPGTVVAASVGTPS